MERPYVGALTSVERFLLLQGIRVHADDNLGQALHICQRRPPCVDVSLALVERARRRYRVPFRLSRVPARCGLCGIQFTVTLLDPSGTEVALHCDADMVRAIVGTRQVKFLSGPTGSQGQDALT